MSERNVRDFRDAEMARLEHSGWVRAAPLRELLEERGLGSPVNAVAARMDAEHWRRAERAIEGLRERFASFRFAEEVEYGLLAVPDPALLDTRGALDVEVRRAFADDLVEDFVDAALGAGATPTVDGASRGGWTVVATVVGERGISAGSYEDVVSTPVERFEIAGVDTRTLMTRGVWGARLLQSPPGVVPDSDYAEKWTFTLFPGEPLVDGRAVSGTVLKGRVRFRLGRADRGIGSARVAPAVPVG